MFRHSMFKYKYAMVVWFQVVHHIAVDKNIVVVADDTDVFALLLHFRHAGSINAGCIYLESPLKGRAVIDIDASVKENLSIILCFLVAHAMTGCDTVASHLRHWEGHGAEGAKSRLHQIVSMYKKRCMPTENILYDYAAIHYYITILNLC